MTAASRRWAPWLFLAPFILLFVVFWLWPLVRSLVLSLHHTAGPQHQTFVGLGNYDFLLHDPLFWQAVWNTTRYTVLFVVLELAIALVLALALNHPRLRWRGALRFAFFSPHLVGGVFVALLFSLLLAQRFGLVNVMLDQVSGVLHALLPFIPATGNEINWGGRPALARIAVLLAGLWLSIGYAMLFLLAALQHVDRELYEAAQLDGAGRWQRFRQVTLPALLPTIGFLALMGTIGAFQLFELPYVLFHNGSGPDHATLTIIMYLYQQGFQTGDLGYAAAIGWAFTLMVLAVSLLQLRLFRDQERT
ncbi:MAG: sugar ABC transporter permease [Planctomycetes bacterium]|nr:sugar ABC transporter permease [Planctomycetota bacterium]